MKIRVEYESTPIRHIAIQCPKCKNWFHSSDLTDKHLYDIVDVECAEYHCPMCNHSWTLQERFMYDLKDALEIEKCSNRKEVHRDTKEKTTKWA